jgi:penicillin G amidase
MGKLVKFLKYLTIILLLLVFGLTAGGYFWLRGKRPAQSGELTLPGLAQPAEVLYDSAGVPHIYAQTEPDAYLVLGYVHAQHRLFQMEAARRLASGRLAEVFGAAALPTDRFFRTLGFAEYARRTVDTAYRAQPQAPHVRAAQAYVAGVNAFIAEGNPPVEFTLAGIPLQPYTLEDMEMISCYMAFSFAQAFKTDPLLTWIQDTYGPDYLVDIAQQWPVGEPMTPTDSLPGLAAPERSPRATAPATTSAALLNLGQQIARWEPAWPVKPYHGSNGWVVAGTRTRSGKPILANDTHIGFGQPSVFFEAHLHCPGFNFYGSFIGGIAMAVLGHHDHGGWGMTMFENDDVDFYQEKINPQNPNQVWFKNGWEDLTLRQEVIKVKDSADVPLTVRRSRHGPLLGQVTRELGLPALSDTTEVALWWTLYAQTSRSTEAFYQLAHARNAQQAAQAASLIHAPGLNIMWADTAGSIAWWATGWLPIRPAQVNPGLLLNGSTGTDEPLGWRPFAHNPQSLNPASGVIITANNQPGNRGPGLEPGYYVPGDRAKRLHQLLATPRRDWDLAAMSQIQNDDLNPNAAALAAQLLPLLPPTANAPEQAARAALQNWDGRHPLGAVAPTIYYRWLYHAQALALTDELGAEKLALALNSHALKRNLAGLMNNPASPWWDDRRTPARETREQILAQAFAQAVAELTRHLGPQVGEWRWARVHTLTHKHPLAVVPVIGPQFNVGPLPLPGGRETVNNLDFALDSTSQAQVTYGPALRRVVDFGTGQAVSINPTGQSGVPGSAHYQDQAHRFAQGQTRPEWRQRAAVEKATVSRLKLVPGP